MTFSLNLNDIQFVLQQIKIAEAHANGIALTDIRLTTVGGEVVTDPNDPIYTDPALRAAAPLAIPDPKTPFGLRTVDGSYNNLIEGREMWGAANEPMPRLFDPSYRDDSDGDAVGFGPGGIIQFENGDYTPGAPLPPGTPGQIQPGSVVDADPRLISNLVADMSLNNPAAIVAALTFAGAENPYETLEVIQVASPDWQADLDVLLSPTASEAAKAAAQININIILSPYEIEVDGTGSLVIPNIAPDEGLSAPFNSWMTFFGQFFDHGLDLISKGGNGTVYIPLSEDDPLYVPNSPTNFMVLTRSTTVTGPDGEPTQNNVTTSWVDQNQTYTSHASHQVFLREYTTGPDGKTMATGNLLDGTGPGGVKNGLPTWADVKAQALEYLGIQLSDFDVISVPLLRTDAYGNFIPDANGYAQIITNIGTDGVPNTADDAVVSWTTNGGNPVTTANAIRTPNAFLDDIAHAASPFDSQTGMAKLADLDSDVGLATAPPPLFVDSFDSADLSTGAPGVVADGLGNYTMTAPAGWTITGGGAFTGGLYDPEPGIIDEAGHSGNNVLWLNGGSTLTGDTGITLVAGRNYTLTFNAGDRDDQSFTGGTVQFMTADGVAIGTPVALPIPANAQWSAVTLTSGSIPGGLAGQQLRIVVTNTGGGQVLIDDVKVTANIPVYDNELLDRHFITGDGRGNENIGLTAVHHVFHSEHNRQVEAQKKTILDSGDIDFLNEWLTVDLNTFPTEAELDALVWDGERLFQAARFATEMQYQHLVFEEFGRKVQPLIDPFVFNSVTDINPSIFAEFANVIYRFGHSMLTDSMPRVFLNEDGSLAGTDDMGLIAAFLNPLAFNNDGTLTAEEAAGAIVRGMTSERGNEIDEFVTGALRNSLLGLPLDLASINIARGRDTGMPSLNEAREELYAATNSTFLKPYTSWVEFAANIKNPLSVVNFLAAYGTHQSILDADDVAAKRDAAWALVFNGPGAPTDRVEFLNGLGAWANQETGLNNIDLWIGGLAEKKMPFGGFLGSTFNAVFEAQMEALQDGDRFYYLTRTQGLNFLNKLEENSFSKMIMANTDIALAGPDGIRGTPDDIITRHIGVDSFANYDFVFEVDPTNQTDYDPNNLSATGVDPVGNDLVLEMLGLGKVVRNDPGTDGPDANYFRTFGGEHVVVGGTSGDDTIITDFGDDGIWGGDGDDRIESGAGVDLVNGGGGDDIITDSGDTGDFLKGEEGDDVIANSNGIDILMGGAGKDVIFVGVDFTEVFAGEGDDFVLGGADMDMLMGNEGHDWIEAGPGFDTTAGDNSELFFNSRIIGHDVMFAGSDEHDFDGESGDDIMVQGESVMRNEGMFGFDWAIYKGVDVDAYADMRIRIFTTEEQDILRNRFDKVEALSGWRHNDTLIGDDRVLEEFPDAATVNLTEGMFFRDELNAEARGRITDFDKIITDELMFRGVYGSDFSDTEQLIFSGGNVLLGGGGNDSIMGRGGDDVIDGDAWLNVRIRITGVGQENTAANQIATVDSLQHTFTDADNVVEAWVGKSLFELMIAREIRPNQLHIVREVLWDSQQTITGEDGNPTQINAVDVAVYWDVRANYTITVNDDGSLTVEHTGFDPGNVPGGDGEEEVEAPALVSDGRDTLYNIEFLRFADGEVPVAHIAAQPFDFIDIIPDLDGDDDPTGTLLAVAVGLEVGAPPITFQWQALSDNGVWENRTTGTSFTPGDADAGREIRVVANVTVLIDSVLVPLTSISIHSAFVGTLGDDDIEGSESPNIIIGLAGENRLEAVGGNDIVYGGIGDDRLDGGLGDDIVHGSAGADRIIGRAGNDQLFGGADDDELSGGHDDDLLDGGAGTDTAGFDGPIQFYQFSRSVTDDEDVIAFDVRGLEGDGRDTLRGIELVDTGGAAPFQLVTAIDTSTDATELLELINLVANGGFANVLAGSDAVEDLIVGTDANQVIRGLSGNDALFAGAGRDAIFGGLGDDLISWRVGDGIDFVSGDNLLGADAGTDTFYAYGDNTAEQFVIYTRAAWAGAYDFGLLSGGTEIIVTRNGAVIAELENINEIVIDGLGGNDSFQTNGDFTGTSLFMNTITLLGGAADDTIDITNLQSEHRIVFKSNGGNDTILGQMRPQDVVELAPGSSVADYTTTTNPNGSITLSNGTSSVTFFGAPGLVGSGNSTPIPPQVFGGMVLDEEDLEDLLDMVRDGLVRDASGYGNNEANPTWGTADNQFIRLTDPYYTDGHSGPRTTALTPRQISDIVSNQDNNGDGIEESIPNAFDGSALLTFFGQYFDHGLDFVPKGGSGSVQIGSAQFPINAPRADIVPGTGIDPDGIPNSGDEVAAQYINKTSPYVDQNQAYGSHDEVTQLLRKWVDTPTGPSASAYLLTGDADATGRALLPTLDHIRENYRTMTGGEELTVGDISNYKGTGQALLIDFIPVITNGQLDLDGIGHYFVAGDGRANENVMLTSIHTVWARNHNFWVDKLKFETGGAWTEEEYFEAARMMNVAEYQRVVFTEFANALAGGLGDDDDGEFDPEHGFEGYDPTVDASISVEFSQAVFRLGHSMLNETLSYVDANGQVQQMSLVEAFLRPDTVSNIGIDGLLAGAAAERHQAIDLDMVNALRNQLVGRPLDLAALNIFRGRDMGIAPFNEVRAQLYEKTGLSSLRPYTDWDDFQSRNNISNAVMNQLKTAYPGGFQTMDLWVGGLAERPRSGQLGSTFAYIFLEQLDRLQHGDRLYYLEIFDDSLFEDNPVSFADIIMRTTGLTGLPENIFASATVDPPTHVGQPPAEDNEDEENPDGPGGDTGEDDDDDNVDPVGDDEDDDDSDPIGDDGDDDEDDDDGNTDPVDDENDDSDDDEEAPPPNNPPPPPPTNAGVDSPYVMFIGTSINDSAAGEGGNDTLLGHDGSDTLIGNGGDDNVVGGLGDDVLFGGAGNDVIVSDDGNDMLMGGAGNDMLIAGAGNDTIFADDGDDLIFGGAGRDVIDAGRGNDTVYAAIGDGDDVLDGGDGTDTLDLSALTAGATVDLGATGIGFMQSSDGGHDTLRGFENVKGGAGNDTIHASNQANTLEGGIGLDTFVFRSAQAANGDTISDFQPGDQIDLRPLYASLNLSQDMSTHLTTDATFNMAGQLNLRIDGADTIIEGTVDGDGGIDFAIRVVGRTNLTNADFS